MVVVLAYQLICLLVVVTAADACAQNPNGLAFLLLSSIVAVQLFNSVLAGGLFGRSGVAGIFAGSLIAVSTFAPIAAVSGGSDFNHYRTCLAVPMGICICSAPLLLARSVWGWQLIVQSSDTVPFRRWRITDFLWLTSAAAVICLLMVRAVERPAMAGQPAATSGFAFTVGYLTVAVLGLASSAVLGISYLYFRRKIGGFITYILLFLLFLPHHLLAGIRGVEPYLVFSGPTLCALLCLLGMYAYKVGGFRLVSYVNRHELADDELTSADKLDFFLSRRSVRVATLLLMMVAVATTLVDYVTEGGRLSSF